MRFSRAAPCTFPRSCIGVLDPAALSFLSNSSGGLARPRGWRRRQSFHEGRGDAILKIYPDEPREPPSRSWSLSVEERAEGAAVTRELLACHPPFSLLQPQRASTLSGGRTSRRRRTQGCGTGEPFPASRCLSGVGPGRPPACVHRLTGGAAAERLRPRSLAGRLRHRPPLPGLPAHPLRGSEAPGGCEWALRAAARQGSGRLATLGVPGSPAAPPPQKKCSSLWNARWRRGRERRRQAGGRHGLRGRGAAAPAGRGSRLPLLLAQAERGLWAPGGRPSAPSSEAFVPPTSPRFPLGSELAAPGGDGAAPARPPPRACLRPRRLLAAGGGRTEPDPAEVAAPLPPAGWARRAVRAPPASPLSGGCGRTADSVPAARVASPAGGGEFQAAQGSQGGGRAGA